LQGFIVDFCCLERRIVLELDGHAHRMEPYSGYDAARSEILEAAGFQVLRVANNDVTRRNLERLLRAVIKNSHFVPLPRRGRGSGGEDTNTNWPHRGDETLSAAAASNW
jgi:hypothetical protein